MSDACPCCNQRDYTAQAVRTFLDGSQETFSHCWYCSVDFNRRPVRNTAEGNNYIELRSLMDLVNYREWWGGSTRNSGGAAVEDKKLCEGWKGTLTKTELDAIGSAWNSEWGTICAAMPVVHDKKKFFTPLGKGKLPSE